MKKFLSLLLAAMMLLSCATAMATSPEIDKVDSVINDSVHAWLDNDNATTTSNDADIDVKVVTNYDSGEDQFGSEGEAATEIWLQVDATGQIDVTVPLVLVFQTNIDGGQATSPTDYKIINHSTADLVVTKIATKKVDFDTNKQPMNMVAWAASAANLAEDTYCVQIHGITGAPGNGKTADATYDLNTAEYKQQAIEGGLFQLAKAPADQKANGNGTDTNLNVSMKTGRLSFVTHRTDDGDTDSMTATKGIQLLTITYTVAIDTSDAYGEEITTATNATTDDRVLSGDNSEATHTKIVEDQDSDATEDNTAD